MLNTLRRNIRWVRAFISGALGALLIGILSALATAPASTLQETGLAQLFFWLLGSGMGPLLLRYALGFLLGALFIEGIMTLWEASNRPRKLRRQYLRALWNENKSLHPREFPDQPRPLIAVNLSMEEILVPQYFVPSRPVYDAPSAQDWLIDEIRNDPGLNAEQRESLIGRVRERWYSDLVQNKGTVGQQQPVELEKLFHWLSAQQPVAIILGTPGAGKSTILRWCTLRMARTLLPEHLPLPAFLAPSQFPLLVRVSDYVRE